MKHIGADISGNTYVYISNVYYFLLRKKLHKNIPFPYKEEIKINNYLSKIPYDGRVVIDFFDAKNGIIK